MNCRRAPRTVPRCRSATTRVVSIRELVEAGWQDGLTVTDQRVLDAVDAGELRPIAPGTRIFTFAEADRWLDALIRRDW